MEHLEYTFAGGRARGGDAPCIVGVVASGNLEILIEPTSSPDACTIEIDTASDGFGAIWKAVLDDFFARHAIAGVRISVNDNGATPAIVALRLDQAVEAFMAKEARQR